MKFCAAAFGGGGKDIIMGAIADFFANIIAGHSVGWIVGQVFGVIAIILGFISYQVKTKRRLIFVQSATSLVFCIHYGLLGAYSGMAMNIICVIRNLVYEGLSAKGIKTKLVPIAFVILQCAMCALTWEAWYSVLILLGIGINTYCMSFSDPQNVRKSVLVTCPMVLVYDIFALSAGGIVYESVATVSAAIGVFRNRKGKSNA